MGDTTNTSASTETEISRENTPDNLPDDLDLEEKSVRIVYHNVGDLNAEETGEIVDDASFARNLAVQERLNVKLEYILSDAANGTDFLKAVRTTLLAGEDAYDVVAGLQYRMTPMAVEGLFHNVADAPYLDYDQPWWADEYMDIISLHEDTRYILTGDITTNLIGNMSAVFVNKQMFQNNFGDPNELYELVLDGGWTMDKLREYAAAAYQDLNSDGAADVGDILGLGSTASSPTEHFAFPMGMQFTARDDEGYPMLIKDQNTNVAVTEKLYQLLYETEGVMVASDANMINKEFPQKFSDGTMLFHANRIGDAALLRDAKDPYGVIPRPKLNEEQESYLSLVHDSTAVFAIPVTCTEIDAACAVLEALAAEGYRQVVPAYYDVTLKIKYAHDDVSSQMLDIIHQNATTDWIYANNYALAAGGSLGTIQRTLMGKKSSDFMSAYTTLAAQVETSLAKLIEEDKNK